jgi:MHS family proline/betaine transporter-like MFS transporter
MGVLLGNIVGAIMRTVMTDEELVAWGWRIPFLSGIIIGAVALLIQAYGTEFNPNDDFYNSESTIDDEPVSQSSRIDIQRTKHPITESFRRENLAPLIASALVPMLAGANYYVTFVW